MAVLQYDWHVSDVVEVVRTAPADKTFYHLHVEDEDGVLVGGVQSRSSLLANPDDVLIDLMVPPRPAVRSETGQEEVSGQIARYDLAVVPVLDQEGSLVGVITVNDVLYVIHYEATKDFHRLGGPQPLECPYFSTQAWITARKRAGWLLLPSVAMIFTGVVTDFLKLVWTQVVPLALFVLLIIDKGRNTGYRHL